MPATITRNIGSSAMRTLATSGRAMAMLGESVRGIFIGSFFPRVLARQIVNIGYGSQTVVIVTGAFTGMVFSAQIIAKFSQFGVESSVGGIVSVAMCRELGPVLAGLMVAGRVGASMAAEIGTMKVTEQIDALRSMSIHPIDYLVTPRLIAMFISMPLLIAESILFGILASYFYSTTLFPLIDSSHYTNQLMAHTEVIDIVIGLIKGTVFGLLIALISCQRGLETVHGAVGVGRSTTLAVVFSSLAILISNFFLTILLNAIFPYN